MNATVGRLGLVSERILSRVLRCATGTGVENTGRWLESYGHVGLAEGGERECAKPARPRWAGAHGSGDT